MALLTHPFCSTEITFFTLRQMKQYLLSLDVQDVFLVMGRSEADRWNLHSFLKELSDRYTLTCLQADVANPNQKDICNVLSAVGKKRCDVMIAIGGGSVIDLAKAISVFYDPGKNDSYTAEEITALIKNKTYQNKGSFLKLIAIPSTAGTGSEVTPWATVWDCGKTSKFSIEAGELQPAQALIVPELTLTLPPMLTLSTALDAVSHAAEAFWSRHTTPLVKDLSLQALRKITVNLKQALNHPENLSLREELCRGSLLAGLAFSKTKTTACHSISYPLSFLYNVPHGFAVSMTLAQVAQINREATLNFDELEEIFQPYGGIGPWIDAVSEGICEIRLRTFGITEQDIPQIVRRAFTAGRMDNNPVDLTEADVTEILKKAQ